MPSPAYEPSQVEAVPLRFHREMAPSFIDYVLTICGVAGLPTGKRLRYCEAGSGRGYGLTLLAAANPDIDFTGIEPNPAFVAESRALAGEAGVTNATFLDISLGDAARAADSPEYDVVAAHGLLSRLDPAGRADLVAFLGARLAAGGAAYVSYTAFPGWAATAPIQHLLAEYASRGAGTPLQRYQRGFQMLRALATGNAAWVAQNPTVKAWLEHMDRQTAGDMAAEFLVGDWSPLYADQAFTALAGAKLSYVGSASICDNRLMWCVPAALTDTIAATPDLGLRELLKDYASNKQFRRDIYVKGPRSLSAAEGQRRFDAIPFALAAVPESLPAKWRIPAGEATIKPAVATAIIDRLRSGPATPPQILAGTSDVVAADLPPALEIFVHNGLVVPGRVGAAAPDAAAARRLNDIIFTAALAGGGHRFLAAPTLGSGIAVSYLERLVAPLVRDNPDAEDGAVAGLVFDRLEAAGKSLSRGGAAVVRNADSIAAMAATVAAFKSRDLPRWRAFGAVA